jgi:hypothetical protein
MKTIKSKAPKPARLICFLAAILGSACILETASSPRVVVITATRDIEDRNPPPSGNDDPIPTPTFTLERAAADTAAPVTLTAGQDLSCVKGPDWILYEWVAGVHEGETVTLLAQAAPEWPDYYYARKADGAECWLFGGSSALNGDAAGLPLREAPPLPMVEYRIDNQTGLPVCNVFIRENGDTALSVDRLGAGTIEPGASFNVSLTAGYYDVAIEECKAGAALYEAYHRAIGSDPASRYTLLNNEVDVFVWNMRDVNLCSVSYRKTGASVWKVLHSIEDGVLAPGEGVTVRFLVGYYDFRFLYCGESGSVAIGLYIGPNTDRIPDPDA